MNLLSVIPCFPACMTSSPAALLPCRRQVRENKEEKGRSQDSELWGNHRETIHNTSVCYIPCITYMFWLSINILTHIFTYISDKEGLDGHRVLWAQDVISNRKHAEKTHVTHGHCQGPTWAVGTGWDVGLWVGWPRWGPWLGTAVGSWSLTLLRHCWSRHWWAQGADTGSCTLGRVSRGLGRDIRDPECLQGPGSHGPNAKDIPGLCEDIS